MAVALIVLTCTTPAVGQLDGAKLEPSSRLGRTKLQSSGPLARPTIKTLALDIAKGELSTAKLQAAASWIPPSKLGGMFYGVAQELEKIEKKVTETSMGYYMAALTVPDGPKYEAAKQRIREVILQKGLPAKDAVRLFDGGRAQFGQLYRANVGIAKSDAQDALEDLSKIKEEYLAGEVVEPRPDGVEVDDEILSELSELSEMSELSELSELLGNWEE